MKTKKIADLSTGAYVNKDAATAEVAKLKADLKAKEDLLNTKLSDEEKMTKAQLERDSEYKAMQDKLAETLKGSNKANAIGLTSDSRTLAGISADDAGFNELISLTISDDNEVTTKIGTHISNILKSAYEKGKSDAVKGGYANNADVKTGGDGGGAEISDAKRLVQQNAATKGSVDLFKI
jgi:hypothetical protein